MYINRLIPLVVFVAACSSNNTPVKVCSQASPELTQRLTDALVRKDFRLLNAWTVKSDKSIDTAAAYFVSGDIVAPNGEAAVGTWLTDNLGAVGRTYAVSPAATKYSTYGGVGDKATSGITVQTGGSRESVACVLTHRAMPTASSTAQ